MHYCTWGCHRVKLVINANARCHFCTSFTLYNAQQFGINAVLPVLTYFVFIGVPIPKIVSEIIQIDRREPTAYTGTIRCDFVSDKYFYGHFKSQLKLDWTRRTKWHRLMSTSKLKCCVTKTIHETNQP